MPIFDSLDTGTSQVILEGAEGSYDEEIDNRCHGALRTDLYGEKELLRQSLTAIDKRRVYVIHEADKIKKRPLKDFLALIEDDVILLAENAKTLPNLETINTSKDDLRHIELMRKYHSEDKLRTFATTLDWIRLYFSKEKKLFKEYIIQSKMVQYPMLRWLEDYEDLLPDVSRLDMMSRRMTRLNFFELMAAVPNAGSRRINFPKRLVPVKTDDDEPEEPIATLKKVSGQKAKKEIKVAPTGASLLSF